MYIDTKSTIPTSN